MDSELNKFDGGDRITNLNPQVTNSIFVFARDSVYIEKTDTIINLSATLNKSFPSAIDKDRSQTFHLFSSIFFFLVFFF